MNRRLNKCRKKRKQRGFSLTEIIIVVLVILIVAMAWPRSPAAPDHIVVRVVDGPTVISTQVVPLH